MEYPAIRATRKTRAVTRRGFRNTLFDARDAMSPTNRFDIEAEGEGDYCASFLGWARVFEVDVFPQGLRGVHRRSRTGRRIDRKNGKSEGEDYRGDGGVLAEKRSALIATAEDLDKVRV